MKLSWQALLFSCSNAENVDLLQHLVLILFHCLLGPIPIMPIMLKMSVASVGWPKLMKLVFSGNIVSEYKIFRTGHIFFCVSEIVLE